MKRFIQVTFFLTIALLAATFFVTPRVHAQNACVMGDTNGDGYVTLGDYITWRDAYINNNPTTVPTSPQASPTSVPGGTGKVKLILHDWPGNNGGHPYPQWVRDNLSWLESQRDFLDGMMVQFPAANDIMTNNPQSYDLLNQQLSPMKNLPATKLKYNFILVYNNKPADPFDDWSGAIQNWKNLAQAAKDNGFVGIAFDNEEYNTPWVAYPDNADYKNKSLAEYQVQTMLRGQQIMQAVTSVFPNIQVIHLHGPYISEPKSVMGVVYTYPHETALMGPFFSGFMQGKGSSAKVIDGGEIYFLRTPAQFAAAYDWQKNGMASDTTNSAFVPPALRPIWRTDLSVSYGIWDHNDLTTGAPMDATIWGTTIYNALKQADDYVWLYVDGGTFLNMGSPQLGPEWATSARNAKNQYNSVALR